MHRLLLILLPILGFLAGIVSANVTTGNPAPTGSSLAYTLGYYVELTNTNTNTTIVIANTTASLGAGPSVGAVEVYNDLGNASQLIVPPPSTVTETITETYNTTYTYTYTTTVITTVVSGTTKYITTQVPVMPTEVQVERPVRWSLILVPLGLLLAGLLLARLG